MTGLESSAPTSHSISGPLAEGLKQTYQNHALINGQRVKHGFNPTANNVGTFHNIGDALCPRAKYSVAKYQSNELLSGKFRKHAQIRNLGLNLGHTITKVNNVDQILLRASSLREGRSFTVSNVGNKGKIYLRPVIRPTNERYLLPPRPRLSISSLDLLSSSNPPEIPEHSSCSTFMPKNHAHRNETALQLTQDISPHVQPDPFCNTNANHAEDKDNERLFSSIENASTLCNPQNPRTSQISSPLKGLGSSNISFIDSAILNQKSSRRHSDTVLESCIQTPTEPNHSNNQTIEPKNILRKSVIIPETFDALTLKPLCNHPSIVQYMVDGKISAATPARLVAEITSPTLVDYGLLSDFFLTFRSFINTADLMHMLIARLEWSLLRIDSIGTIVSVRTFVAIRHWILNYFLDDFLEDRELRKLFCHLVNDFVNQIFPYPYQFKVPLKILRELKRCWRRVCALHWAGLETDGDEEILSPIGPGGFDSQELFCPEYTSIKKNQNEREQKYKICNQSSLQNLKMISESRRILTEPLRIEITRSLSPLTDASNSMKPTMPKIIASKQRTRSQKNLFKTIGVGSHRLPHVQSKCSLFERGRSMVKLPSKSNKKCAQDQQQISGNKNSNTLDHKHTQRELNQNKKFSLANSTSDSIGRCGFLSFKRQPMDIMSPVSSIKAPILVNDSVHCFNILEPQKNLVANSGPSIKKLIKNVRRAFSNSNIQTFDPLHPQKYFPLLSSRSLGTTFSQASDIDLSKDLAESLSSDSSNRIDTLSLGAAIELENVGKNINDKSTWLWNESHLSKDEDNHNDHKLPTTQAETIVQPTHGVHDGEILSRATTVSKSILNNDSSTSKSFVLSGFSYYPSVDAFATAYMRPSSGPTTHITPSDRFPDIYGHEIASEKPEKVNKSFSCEETPSLVVDSCSSTEEEKLSCYNNKFEESGQAPTRHSSEMHRSNQFCAFYNSSFTRWISERSSGASTFSEANFEGNRHPSNPTSIPLCLRPLRRRPGGYLRTADNLNNASQFSFERPKSASSYPTVSTSRSSQKSYLPLGVTSSIFDKSEKEDQISSRQTPENYSRKYSSIFGSQLNLHSSFEKKVQLLAQLPDDIDEGTAESALLKLEGKFEKVQTNPVDTVESFSALQNQDGPSIFDTCSISSAPEGRELWKKRNYALEPPLKAPFSFHACQPMFNQKESCEEPENYELPENSGNSSQSANFSNKNPDKHIQPFKYDQSKYIENTPPRSLSNRYSLQYPINGSQFVASSPQVSELSFNTSLRPTIKRTKIFSAKEQTPYDKRCKDTFFNVESDVESEFFLKSPNASLYRLNYMDKRVTPNTSNLFLPIQANTAMGELQDSLSPSSIPFMNISQGIKIPSEIGNDKEKLCYDSNKAAVLEPSASGAEMPACLNEKERNYRGASITMNPLGLHQISHSQKTVNSSHLPFILAFDSDTLAQQFTLVEKDSLSQIGWRELVEMKWNNSHHEVVSWVSYLKSKKSTNGTQTFLTRFNLMIKWVISECVLTHDLTERVSCLIKFIHIADKCRKYRNFATMTQITIALTSQDIVYLANTWIHVPTVEIQTLQELAALVFSSQSNHNLRTEMENPDIVQGCIPYIQIYTRELLKNCNLPLRISNSSNSEPLINFQKCRTNAVVIKSVLKLLEASQKYQFSLIRPIYERCYWIAALSDEQILGHKKLIQDSNPT
ncbi:guanine nucleotide exchange factor LTE1 [Erysiphe neolycopersici]|uniref:Guanine nucleotide exchange factor LTE1 n=1 Tax=Erysiphe neolycopersici TaxID=212602 RepID=A0A420HD18_9PEZI|nr:guanine nucleotide exchange factor LTE1 [Erysiphe neolycopersici]